MEKIRLMLADDHHLFLEGLQDMLSLIPEIEIKATAQDGEEVLRKLRSTKIDILLLDIQMPKLNGLETAQEVSRNYPKTKIIVLSMHNEKAFIQKMYQNNVHGYLLKTTSKTELLNAIQIVYRGGKCFSAETTVALLENNSGKKGSMLGDEQLSKKEIEILVLIAKGKTNQEIADLLHKSIHTIKTHRKNLLFKLNAGNTAGLTSYAIKKNMLD